MPRRSKKKIILYAIALLVVVVLVYEWWTGSPPTAPVTQVNAGGSYDTLTSAQRRLVDDWVARYATVTGKPAVPAELYDGLALSTKTTLNAVTHALSVTTLTDATGRSIAAILAAIAAIIVLIGQILSESKEDEAETKRK